MKSEYREVTEACAFLRDVRADLSAALMKYSRYRIVVRTDAPWEVDEPYVELQSPRSFSKAIEGLPDHERERIVRSIAATDDRLPESKVGAHRLLLDDRADVRPDQQAVLLAELVCQRDLLIDVATGGARFNDVNDYYKRRRRVIAQMMPEGQTDPSPFHDLWDWHKHWNDENWTKWAERRSYISSLYNPVIQQLLEAYGEDAVPEREPTGWERVDRALLKARTALEGANEEEDFQAVGLLCRETLISLGQAVYDPRAHEAPDGITPSPTDAKRMLEAFIAGTVPGESNETLRRHARASLALALELQHRRTAAFRLAALCLEVTSSTVNVVAILSGVRD